MDCNKTILYVIFLLNNTWRYIIYKLVFRMKNCMIRGTWLGREGKVKVGPFIFWQTKPEARCLP